MYATQGMHIPVVDAELKYRNTISHYSWQWALFFYFQKVQTTTRFRANSINMRTPFKIIINGHAT